MKTVSQKVGGQPKKSNRIRLGTKNYPLDRRQFLKRTLWGGAATALLGTYPLFIERYIVEVNRYVIPVLHLPHEFDGLRIIQLTDLHYGPLMPLHVLATVIQKTNELEKDIVVCTGDYVRGAAAARKIETIWTVMANLHALGGVYTVLGNHDHWASTEESLHWLNKSGHINLRHKAIPLSRNGKTLWLGGAGDLWEDHVNLDQVLKDVPDDACRIVLAHNPDTADTNYTTRVDLMISGHTHGGQVKMPFIGTPFLPVRNKAYASGFVRSCKTDVFISRGIGWAALPVRVNCFPEIAVLNIVRGKEEAKPSIKPIPE
jgi:predicted MPP superfamily phosphohydrolase